MLPKPRAFTRIADGRPNVLQSECYIAPAGIEDFQEFLTIWDTGATHSSITQGVVEKCGLKSIGRTIMHHAGVEDEPDETDTYLVNIKLPNPVRINNIQVSRGGFNGGDVLFGMDIINLGDFAITHAGGKSKFTFQVPSQADIDFTKGQPLPPPRNREERRAKKRRKRR